MPSAAPFFTVINAFFSLASDPYRITLSLNAPNIDSSIRYYKIHILRNSNPTVMI